MQGGRGRPDPFFDFGDPFTSFGGMPSPFGGRDPFDDPFFTHPFGGMLQQSPFRHAGSPFGSSLFGPSRSPFMDAHAPRIYEHSQSMPSSSRGPIIEELNSDDEKEEPEAGHGKKGNLQRHDKSRRQPYVEHPDDGNKGRELRQTHHGSQSSIMHDTHSRPQAHSFTFESSSVTYGGSNGAYYTSSTTRRAGSDGLRFEEHKEADSVTREAAHRISRGIHDKGHTVSRHLNSDGQVDTMQMLHNINEDELAGFEEAWTGKGGKSGHDGFGVARRGGRALPSTENTDAGERRGAGAAERAQSSKVRRRW